MKNKYATGIQESDIPVVLITSPDERYQTSLSLEKSFPTDEALQVKAREILGVEHTSAEDPEFLENKAMHSTLCTTYLSIFISKLMRLLTMNVLFSTVFVYQTGALREQLATIGMFCCMQRSPADCHKAVSSESASGCASAGGGSKSALGLIID